VAAGVGEVGDEREIGLLVVAVALEDAEQIAGGVVVPACEGGVFGEGACGAEVGGSGFFA
jgi:hypothetical protein